MSRIGRAAVMVGQRFEMREYPVPEPAPGTILLRQELAGICGTDLHNWQFQRLQGDILLGHENVGIVEELGEGVETDYLGKPLRVGDRVVFAPGTASGAYGFWSADAVPHFRGGFADYTYLGQPPTCVLRTTLPPEVAVLIEPFTIGVHAAMRARVQFGETVVIQGSGAIGLVTLVCAKVSGAGRLIVVGGPAGRLELAREMGADVVIDIAQVRDPAERTKLVREQTPRGAGADVVFECAGFLPAIPEGLGYLRYSGTFVEMGQFVDVGSLDLNPNQLLMRKNLRLEAIWGSTYEHFVRGLPVLEKNEFPFARMISHVLPLERVADGFDALSGSYRLDGRDAIKIAVKGGA
ncbi:MAG: zinc-binding dehydrogenase [Chloroflexi bacterium]|nr:zinc-binding dehydrogenase [Chloroflexota bacterium]